MNDFKEAVAKPEPGMSAHSPGPWAIDWNYAGGGSLEDHPYLHYANIHSNRYMESAPKGLSITGYIRKEDAVLIAAAPDLLDALKSLVERIDINGGIGEYQGGPAFVMDLARKAIAKAEGQS